MSLGFGGYDTRISESRMVKEVGVKTYDTTSEINNPYISAIMGIAKYLSEPHTVKRGLETTLHFDVNVSLVTTMQPTAERIRKFSKLEIAAIDLLQLSMLPELDVDAYTETVREAFNKEKVPDKLLMYLKLCDGDVEEATRQAVTSSKLFDVNTKYVAMFPEGAEK